MKLFIGFAVIAAVISVPFIVDLRERIAADKKSGKKEYTKINWF